MARWLEPRVRCTAPNCVVATSHILHLQRVPNPPLTLACAVPQKLKVRQTDVEAQLADMTLSPKELIGHCKQYSTAGACQCCMGTYTQV